MKTVFAFFSTVLFSVSAISQTSAEVTCRAQAKEAAVQTYSSCITTARANQVEEIRKSYKEELAALKAKYDKELKKMSGAAKAEKSVVRTSQASRPVKGIAKSLPTKSASTVDIQEVETVPEANKVVAVGNEDAQLENEAAQAEQTEIVEMPVE
ncbi:hypothetical protein [Bdellovibrio reynosensis]|uniref:Uncharacterized protein n=1 Tax=Bdellovibrio reynosensis TaxID=2835041 RepID=A0ABY4CDT4_9BACT|nr:hypothetical protein [Bdellovibrio reynosensis]UOF01831.1 hypothetical protein MNR06_02545 [Bdellovibrio reynosensis]